MVVERFFNVTLIYENEKQTERKTIKIRAKDKQTASWLAKNIFISENGSNVTIHKTFVDDVKLKDNDNLVILDVFNREYKDFSELISKHTGMDGFLELYTTFNCYGFKTSGIVSSFIMDFMGFTVELELIKDKISINTDCIIYLAKSGIKYIVEDNWSKYYYG